MALFPATFNTLFGRDVALAVMPLIAAMPLVSKRAGELSHRALNCKTPTKAPEKATFDFSSCRHALMAAKVKAVSATRTKLSDL